MRIRSIYPLILLFLPFLLFQCRKDQGGSIFGENPTITYNNGQVTCQGCINFADLVELDDKHLFISGGRKLYCLEYSQDRWEMKQSFDAEGDISSITIEGNNLFLGITLPDGDGVVKVYEKLAGFWTETQELSSKNKRDNFGARVAFEEGHLLVGANSPWTIYIEPPGPPGIYFFHKIDGLWELSKGYDNLGLGNSVALQGNYAFAGAYRGLFTFHFDGNEWIRKDSFPFRLIEKLQVENNHLFIKSGYLFQPLIAFEIQEGKIIAEEPIHYEEIGRTSICYHGDVIKMHDNQVAIGVENWDLDSKGGVLLLEFNDGAWKVKETILPPSEASVRVAYSFAISNNWIAIADDYSYPKMVSLIRRQR